MRNYIILNGVNSNTITGLLISTLPPITKPKIRTQTEEIDGRDGDIVTKLGYSAYDKEFEIGLYGDFDINEVISYFNSEGTVVFSNEEDKYYNYQILDQIDYEKLIRFKTATIRMHVQPFKYPLEEEQIQVDATVVTGEGSNISLQYTNPNHTITSELKGDLYQETTTGKNLFSSGMELGIIDNTTGQNANNNNCIRSIDYIPVKPNTTYTLSNLLNYNCLVHEYAEDKTYIQYDGNYNSPRTFTTTANTYYIRVRSSAGQIQNDLNAKYQLELGDTPSEYEEYTGGQPSPNPDYPQEIEVVTGQQEILVEGKNLFNKNLLQQGGLDLGGTGIETPNPTRIRSNFIKVKPNAQYTISNTDTIIDQCGIGLYKNDNSYDTSHKINNGGWNNFPITFTTQNDTTYIRISFRNSNNANITPDLDYQIQLEKGSEATDFVEYHSQSYTIDLGTTELYGIPDTTYRDRVYQDNNMWYIERQVGKVVLNGSENWVKSTIWSSANYFIGVCTDYNSLFKDINTLISNYFRNNETIGTTTPTTEGIGYYSSAFGIRISIKSTTVNTVEDFKTWLGNHNTIVYYVLKTPTTEEITDTTLLGQLNELSGATTYENTTNISVTGSLPVILKATTSGMPNTVINNIGNIYAKPLITIYGSGTIGVYLNQIQVLQIELGNNESITIDVSKMEAYNNSTKALMNRLVTGDYMKFLINSGENNIAFSGNVAGFTMDNYTRWL